MEDWAALPWWQQRLYAEGLAEEFGDPEDGPAADPGGSTIALNGDPGELAVLGFKERTLTLN